MSSTMIIIGHRGARGLAPENTIESLQIAVDHKVDRIEFDVRVTKNGVPVLCHNKLPENTTQLPTLAEVLKRFGGKTPLYIEIKRGESCPPIIEVIRNAMKHGLKNTDYWVASKSYKTLREFHDAFPEVGTLVIEPWSSMRAITRTRRLQTRKLAMNHHFLWRGVIKFLVRQNYELYVYTLNNPKKAARWEKYDIAGVITDYPDRFKSS